jgi:hypothetical protein
MGKFVGPDIHPRGRSIGGDGSGGADDEDISIGLYVGEERRRRLCGSMFNVFNVLQRKAQHNTTKHSTA